MRKIFVLSIFLIMSTFSYAENINTGSTIYVVEEGDTLWGIAQQFYQNPWMWPRIWEANAFVDNPHLIYPGKPLAIPKVVSAPTGTNVSSATNTNDNATNSQSDKTNNTVTAQASNTSTTNINETAQQQTTVSEQNQTETAKTEENNTVATNEEPEENIPSLAQQNNQGLSDGEVGEMPEEEREKTVTTIVIPQPKPRKYFVRIGSEGFISKYSISSYGKIIDSNDSGKLLYSLGDFLFINLGESDGIIPGDLFEVFEQIKPVKDRESKDTLGYLVRSKGILKVIEVFKDTSKVEISTCYDAIKVNDSIKPFEKFPKKIKIHPNSTNATGYILGLMDNRYSVGENDIIYINVGKHDGLEVGNVIEIYINERKIYDRSKSKYETIPPFLLGKAIIIDAQERTSTALITNSIKEIFSGSSIRTVVNK